MRRVAAVLDAEKRLKSYSWHKSIADAQILMAGRALGNGHFPPIPTLPGEREKTSKWECNCVRVAPECEAFHVPRLLAPATCPNYTRSYDAGPRIILPYVMDTCNVFPHRSWKFYKVSLRLSHSHRLRSPDAGENFSLSLFFLFSGTYATERWILDFVFCFCYSLSLALVYLMTEPRKHLLCMIFDDTRFGMHIKH